MPDAPFSASPTVAKIFIQPLVLAVFPIVTEFTIPNPLINPFMTDHGSSVALTDQLRTPFFILQIPHYRLLHSLIKYPVLRLCGMSQVSSSLSIVGIINPGKTTAFRSIPIKLPTNG